MVSTGKWEVSVPSIIPAWEMRMSGVGWDVDVPFSGCGSRRATGIAPVTATRGLGGRAHEVVQQ